MEETERLDKEGAYELARQVTNDPEQNEYAKEYANALLRDEMDGETLEIQLQYIASNGTDEVKKSVSEILGYFDPDNEFLFGYCQICGTRDGNKAYQGDSAGYGLVCIGCYDDVGEPDTCEKCGNQTYEGDSFIGGPREDEFYCNNCLLKLPTGAPSES